MSAVRKKGWHVRSIEPHELPAVCPYCRVRRPDQAVAVVAFRVVDVMPSGEEVVVSQRASPACVDHGVYVQQRYILAGS